MFQGSIPALITPFKNGKVDEQAFQDLVEWQIEQGSDALVPVGTTGESPTLSHDEHHRVVALCVEAAKGRVPVIAGTGSNNTAEAISLQKHAKKAGVTAGLVVTPYYNKPTQNGLIAHYKAINDAVELPIIIYNIPARSVIDMTPATMAELAKLPNIIGVKDATGDLSRPLNTYLACGADFCQLSGEDATAIQFLSAGGSGCISVTANIAPKLCSDMQKAWRDGDIKKAMDLQFKLLPLHNAMFCESSPGPVKYAAELLGLCTSETRLPLIEIAESSKERVRAALSALGMI
ncbi:MAG: 4-hydroxy-tetrahydrodipicolinate synthase [Methylocystaceae bacterium]|nr:4-hydroxy-tetrahydrodipicolinate synthase [Methylocystaceae bacterium]